MTPAAHVPVLCEEFLSLCPPGPDSILLDVTVGHGGHAQAFLEATGGTGRVWGLDADAAALTVAREKLRAYQGRVELREGNFVHLKDSMSGGGILQQEFTHVLFDLGIGSHQLADPQRGFSFQEGTKLSMRYGDLHDLPPAQLTALNALERHIGVYPDVADLLRGLSAKDLADVIYHYGEERYSRRIAAALKAAVMHRPIVSAQELGTIVAAAVPASYERGRIHPATRTFQALRLAVNRELEAVTVALPQAVEVLTPGGYLAVISFHSLEDRIVKQFLRAAKPTLTVLTKKPLRASSAEIAHNPRARSAKLRAGRKGP